jgi:hypothetical protein
MSLLLTRHVDQYGIDICDRLRRAAGPDRLRAARLQPLPDQLTVQTIMLDDQHALHGWPAA